MLPGRGEIELAYGEAKIFDAKYAWPDYGDHPCVKTIDKLFEDVHKTWPLEPTPCEPSLPESENSSTASPAAEEIVIKDAVLAIATAEAASDDPENDEPASVQVGDPAPSVCVGVDAERTATQGS